MGCYKLDEKNVYIVCSCGHDYSIPFKDLKADYANIFLPLCPGCKEVRMTLFINNIDDEQLKMMPDAAKKRHIINHTVHKRLVAAGQESDDLKKRGVPSAMHKLAVNDDIVEAPLHPRIMEAKKDKEDPGWRRRDKAIRKEKSKEIEE